MFYEVFHACLRPPPLLPLTRPQSAHHRNPRPGGGSADAADARGPGASSSHRFSWASWGGPGPRPRDPADAHDARFGGVFQQQKTSQIPSVLWVHVKTPLNRSFTRSNGFVPTKHPNSRTPNALKGIRGLGGRPLMLMMLPFLGPKRLPKPKNTCLQRFLKVFRRQNACIECF